MSADFEMDDRSRAIERGLALLHFVAAGLLALRWMEWGSQRLLALTVGVSLAAVGLGLLLHMRWARWITLGTSFLAILAAFAAPMWLALYRPFDGFQPDQPGRMELMTCAFAATFGWLGYQGLRFLRSPGAKALYEVNDQINDPARRPESSLAVVAAALFVGVVLMGLQILRDGGLQQLSPPGRPQASANAPDKTLLPDLEVTDLCLQGESLVQAVVWNRGKGWSDRKFTIEYDDLRFRGGKDHSVAPVPRPGQMELVALNNAINPAEQEYSQLRVLLVVDSKGDVHESSKVNNVRDFPISFRYNYPEMQPCDSLTAKQP